MCMHTQGVHRLSGFMVCMDTQGEHGLLGFRVYVASGCIWIPLERSHVSGVSLQQIQHLVWQLGFGVWGVEKDFSLDLSRRTVNLRSPERARNEGSTGP